MRLSPILVAVSLAGCATTSGAPGGLGGGSSEGIINLVTGSAVKFCAFQPTASTVANILAKLSGPATSAGIQVADQVAKGICNAVTGVRQAELGEMRVLLTAMQEMESGGNTTQLAQVTTGVAGAIKVQPGTAKKPPRVNGVIVRGDMLKSVSMWVIEAIAAFIVVTRPDGGQMLIEKDHISTATELPEKRADCLPGCTLLILEGGTKQLVKETLKELSKQLKKGAIPNQEPESR